MVLHLFRATAILLLALLAAGLARAEGLSSDVWYTDVPQAWQTAQQRQQPMVIFVSMDHCPHCVRMAGQTLGDRELQRELKADFVPVVVKLEEHRDLVKELGIQTFPTTMFVAPDTTVLDELKGFHTAAQMKKRIGGVRQALRNAAPRIESAGRQAPLPR